MASLPHDDYADKIPLFDPYVFNEEHGPLLVEDYRIKQSELQQWAERASKIRQAIVVKANRYVEIVKDVEEVNETGRSRKGHKRSKP